MIMLVNCGCLRFCLCFAACVCFAQFYQLKISEFMYVKFYCVVLHLALKIIIFNCGFKIFLQIKGSRFFYFLIFFTAKCITEDVAYTTYIFYKFGTFLLVTEEMDHLISIYWQRKPYVISNHLYCLFLIMFDGHFYFKCCRNKLNSNH